MISKTETDEITIEYARELLGAGYNPKWIRNAIESAVKGYENVIGMIREGKTTRNRPGYSTRMSRRAKKLAGSTTWFKKTKDQDKHSPNEPKPKTRTKPTGAPKTDAVMPIPHTPGGKLRSMLTQMQNGLSFTGKVRY